MFVKFYKHIKTGNIYKILTVMSYSGPDANEDTVLYVDDHNRKIQMSSYTQRKHKMLEGKLQASLGPIKQGTMLVVYHSIHKPDLIWYRAKDEFFDPSRFTETNI